VVSLIPVAAARSETLIGPAAWMQVILLGAVVSLVALAVSLPVAIATLAFYVGYRLFEDYLLVLRIMGSTVQVPAVVSLVAVLVGGALLGIVGALVAIPAAAALRLLLEEVMFRRLEQQLNPR
jgi:predicted PurR-regulated permease PerM